MSAIPLYSKSLAQNIQSEIKAFIQTVQLEGLRPPSLAMIVIGNLPASLAYIKQKKRVCEQIGIASHLLTFPTLLESELLALIKKLNHDETIDGILIQLPLPEHINTFNILDAISPKKDVDGFHPDNMGLLAQGRPYFRACTPYGIMTLLESLPTLSLKGMNTVVVGASNIVGKPMTFELLNAQCTVTLCHAATQNLEKHIRYADLLVSAIGKPNVIKSDWIKPNSIVVDAGIIRTASGKITGDIDYATAFLKTKAITPVPGGVGPMTVAMLMKNTWQAYQIHHDLI